MFGLYAVLAFHVRLATPHGAVHLWAPTDYDRETADVVVYVHGYRVSVDEAWRAHRLPQQFADSKRNALFVACEAPGWIDQPVAWANLDELLATVATELDEDYPRGAITVVGHSAANRTISAWLETSTLDSLVLLDAFYGEPLGLRAWLHADPQHRLIDIASLTREFADTFHAAHPETLVFDRMPTDREAEAIAGARIVYIRTTSDHLELVTDGVTIPLVLRYR